MRILLVSHPALVAELGASQVALSLAAALRARGHDARAWSPEPLPAGSRWWNLWLRQRQAIERFAAAEGPFDVIDTPAISASRKLAHSGSIVVRSVQPELRYLFRGIRDDFSRHPSPRAVAHAVAHTALGSAQGGAILAGWRRARLILCLGSAELAWMRRRFPRWAPKLGLYFNTLPAEERVALADVRRGRRSAPADTGRGVSFLWMGRWTPHKGTRRLREFVRERLAARPCDSFTLAGCGPAAERELPAEWLRSGRVRLVPAYTRAQLPPLLAAHQAGLFTSEVEGWGLNLNEMLESGMPVFATEAGGMSDLKRYFPSSLRPFPPPAEVDARPPEDIEANGYIATFSWPGIARSYERQLLGREGGERL
ncbi:MAG TPA: glycosyltransferase [Thermoanaerobaculia bacterium]|nr:glycosyltransferase [Thermoanaerobaculia bacterium]